MLTRRSVLTAALLSLALYAAAASPAAAAGERTLLASGGQARFPVVVAPEAGERVRAAAADLAACLEHISGARFTVEEGDGTRGLAVGTFADFPVLGLDGLFDPADLRRRDEYLLRSHPHGAYLVGATELAAQHAAWDLLHRLGYRLFFPTDTWEHVPADPAPAIAVNTFESPDYVNRSAPRGAPRTDRDLWRRWRDRNRTTPSFSLSTGHAYGGIIRRNRRAFEENPEFFALVNGERGGGRGDKFCISNPDLRALVVADAIARTGPETDSISMDPSDGASWCECEPCAEMGSISDRVIILANEVAAAINELGLGDKYVGTYAYASHSPPPAVDVHPKVIVSIATSFIRGGYTIEELVEGWSARTEMIGVREYHDVHTWSRAMPRRARGGNVNYLARRIPWFHEQGARFMNSENSDSWGANGLGYWLTPILLWDVSAAERIDEYIEDFLDKAFGAAKEPMRAFYYLISQDHGTVRTSDDILARMFTHLARARELAADPAVRARLDELVLYTRYVELKYAAGDRPSAQQAQALFNHAYRMRDTLLVHIGSLDRWLRRRGVEVPVNMGRLAVGTPGVDNPPWKSSEPFSGDEIDSFLAAGLAAYEKVVMPFEPVTFSDDLVPAAAALELPEVPTGTFGRGNSFRGRQTMFTWLPEEDRDLRLRVTGGMIAHYRNRGNVRFELYSPLEETLDPVAEDESTPPDGNEYEVVLRSPHAGLHQLDWSDGGDRTRVLWPENQPLTVRSCFDSPARLSSGRRLYFYVPRGTEIVGGYTTGGRGLIRDHQQEVIFDFASIEEGEGYFAIPVPPGRDGTIWEINNPAGRQMFLTVPPWLARNAAELLLPREVVERDAAANR